MKGYGLPQKDYVKLLKRRIEEFKKQEPDEDYQIMDLRFSYDEEEYPVTDEINEIDFFIINNAIELGKIESDLNETHWVWNLDQISEGKFPIKHIPSHIRGVAQKLYYSKE